jgi:hypothetical protein
VKIPFCRGLQPISTFAFLGEASGSGTWYEEIRRALGVAKMSNNPHAPNPVTGLWSGCTRLHSQRLRGAIFD